MATTIAAVTALAAPASGCGGGAPDDEIEPATPVITVWTLENEPDRMRATRENVLALTTGTGIRVRLVGVGDDALAARMAAAKAARRLPDVVQLPLASVHAYARDGTLDTHAAESVVERLGEDTFSQTALSLVSRRGQLAAVPSDGWGQLLIYRKDLFRRAGLRAPRSLEDVGRAAARLDRDGTAGITLATAPHDAFTAETFEHVALAAGCRVVDDRGRVTLTSPACRRAFRLYVRLARRDSVGGVQDVDTTRAAYFAGRAAMIFWSPFLLDAMAGLRDDAVPTCPQCRRDPAFLARHSGLVGALSSRGGQPAQFGEIASWGITAGADADAAERFVAFMLSEGYVRWLALSPQGKYPVRTGDRANPDGYAAAWARLQGGVERKAPLRRFYSRRSIASLGDGVRSFTRWGFPQNQAALMGALRGPQPVTRALAAAIRGDLGPVAAARRAQARVERIAASIRQPRRG